MTSIRDYRNDDPRTAQEVADAIEAELRDVQPSAATVEGTQHYALIQSVAQAFADTEESLADLYNAAYLTDATGEELTKKAREVGVQRQAATAATGVVTFQRDSPASTEYVVPSGTVVGTGGDDTIRFQTTSTATIGVNESQASANVRCTEDGSVGNVGTDTVRTLVSGSVSGVDSVTNTQPIGDPSYTLTDNETVQTAGQPREDDASLRDRALDSTAIGGAGTAEATELALENIEDVISADVKTNRTANTVDGIDPYNTEIRVYGGTTAEIADRLYNVLPYPTLESLQGGANGTKDSVTLTKDVFGEITVSITRPTITSLSVDISVVHDATYDGTQAVTDALVRYVGGTTTDARDVTGLGQGESVLVNEIENVAEDIQGVQYADVTLVDADGDGTDDTTTDADGVPVFAVAENEVATIDATDVTVTETAR